MLELLRRSTLCDPGSWRERDGRERVLVEAADAWAFAAGLEAAGYDVLTCTGPRAGDERCPLLEHGACSAAAGADLILSALPESAGGPEIVAALAAAHPGTPVVVEAPRPKAALYRIASAVVEAPAGLPGLVDALAGAR